MNRLSQILMSILTVVILQGCNGNSTSNVAVLDLEAIMKATKQDEVFKAQIKQADGELSDQLKGLAANMEKKLAEVREGYGEKPSDEQKVQYQQNVQQANIELKQSQALAQSKLQQYEQSIIATWRGEILPVAQGVAEEKGFDIVMVTNPAMMWFSDSVDITDEVLGKVRKQSSDVNADKVETGSAEGGE